MVGVYFMRRRIKKSGVRNQNKIKECFVNNYINLVFEAGFGL